MRSNVVAITLALAVAATACSASPELVASDRLAPTVTPDEPNFGGLAEAEDQYVPTAVPATPVDEWVDLGPRSLPFPGLPPVFAAVLQAESQTICPTSIALGIWYPYVAAAEPLPAGTLIGDLAAQGREPFVIVIDEAEGMTDREIQDALELVNYQLDRLVQDNEAITKDLDTCELVGDHVGSSELVSVLVASETIPVGTRHDQILDFVEAADRARWTLGPQFGYLATADSWSQTPACTLDRAIPAGTVMLTDPYRQVLETTTVIPAGTSVDELVQAPTLYLTAQVLPLCLHEGPEVVGSIAELLEFSGAVVVVDVPAGETLMRDLFGPP